MSKAVLLIDMPENCYQCNFCTEGDECLAVGRESIDVDVLKGKPNWCPLEPLPGLMPPEDMFNNGWNAFRFAIGGEEEK